MLQQSLSDSSLPTTSTVAAAANASWDLFAHRRSRSSSPYTDSFLIDLSYLDLEDPDIDLKDYAPKANITELLLNNNLLKVFPPILIQFANIETLDLSSNCLKVIDENICKLVNLKVLLVKENELKDASLPKDFANKLTKLEIVHLSGN